MKIICTKKLQWHKSVNVEVNRVRLEKIIGNFVRKSNKEIQTVGEGKRSKGDRNLKKRKRDVQSREGEMEKEARRGKRIVAFSVRQKKLERSQYCWVLAGNLEERGRWCEKCQWKSLVSLWSALNLVNLVQSLQMILSVSWQYFNIRSRLDAKFIYLVVPSEVGV